MALLDRAWAFLIGAWTKEGCGLDPNGRCAPTSTDRTDIGCGIDPDGRCGL
jgi:hypothetical protein